MSHSERSFCRHCHPCILAFLHPLQFDVCGCVGVRAIVAWVATGSTSSECRVRFQAGASSESTGGPVSGIVCCVDFLEDHPVCQRRVGPSVSILVHLCGMCMSSRRAGNSSEFMGGRVTNTATQSLLSQPDSQPLTACHCTATAIVAPQ